jgi:glycosyltransferase involved in cell wall biosynthesis
MTRAQMLHAASPLPPAEAGIHFAFIGRFDNLKDPLVALRAMAILQCRGIACRLLMIGDGSPEQKQMLQHFVREHRLQDWVEFLGFVSDVSTCLKRIHVLLMPSRGDAFGRVTAEAMAHGRPVIGANACATPELVRDGIDGLIFTVGHAEELADKMQALIENPTKMAEMGRNAAQRAQAAFTNEQYAAAVMNIYSTDHHWMPRHKHAALRPACRLHPAIRKA